MYNLYSFNSLVNRSIMKSNQDKTDSFYNLVNKNGFLNILIKSKIVLA